MDNVGSGVALIWRRGNRRSGVCLGGFMDRKRGEGGVFGTLQNVWLRGAFKKKEKLAKVGLLDQPADPPSPSPKVGPI